VDDHYRFKEDPPEIFPMRTILKQKNIDHSATTIQTTGIDDENLSA
jgi:hypothetical protein